MPLFSAIEQGNTEQVRKLLNNNLNLLNTLNTDSNTPLHVAVYSNQKEIVKLLLDKKANVNALGNSSVPPLWYVSSVPARDRAEMIKILLSYGADPNHDKLVDDDKNTLLHRIATYPENDFRIAVEIAKLLLEKGAKINAPGNSRVTPLYYAAKAKNSALVKLLLEKGAEYQATITILKQHGYSEDIVDFIRDWTLDQSTELPLIVSENDRTMLFECVRNGNESVIKKLIKKYRHNDDLLFKFVNSREGERSLSALHVAALIGCYDIAKLLLDAKAHTELTDRLYRTPYYCAIARSNFAIAKLILEYCQNPRGAALTKREGETQPIINTLSDIEKNLVDKDIAEIEAHRRSPIKIRELRNLQSNRIFPETTVGLTGATSVFGIGMIIFALQEENKESQFWIFFLGLTLLATAGYKFSIAMHHGFFKPAKKILDNLVEITKNGNDAVIKLSDQAVELMKTGQEVSYNLSNDVAEFLKNGREAVVAIGDAAKSGQFRPQVEVRGNQLFIKAEASANLLRFS